MVVQAYDQHLNIILGEVEETITTLEIDDETYEEIVKVCKAAAPGRYPRVEENAICCLRGAY